MKHRAVFSNGKVMLNLQIMFAAKAECRNLGTGLIIWKNHPFIQRQIEECFKLHRKILSKEKQAIKIFGNIQEIQDAYEKILRERDETMQNYEKDIQQKRSDSEKKDEEIAAVAANMQEYNDGKPMQTTETYEQIKARHKALLEERNNLELGIEELRGKQKKAVSNANKRRDEKRNELIKEYKKFSNRINIVANKIRSKTEVKETQAKKYADYFWKFYNRKRNKKMQSRPPLLHNDFKTPEIFAGQKQVINEFNQKHSINYKIILFL